MKAFDERTWSEAFLIKISERKFSIKLLQEKDLRNLIFSAFGVYQAFASQNYVSGWNFNETHCGCTKPARALSSSPIDNENMTSKENFKKIFKIVAARSVHGFQLLHHFTQPERSNKPGVIF